MATVLEFGSPSTLPRLQRLRNAQRLTQQALADLIGVDRATVRRWERGTARIPQIHRADLARIFGASIDHLMGEPWHANAH